MHYPEFFDTAPVITMRDPLAEFLGAMQGGVIEYRYADVVALAGHSCPTVASTFLMLRAGLSALYSGETAERGGISVEFRGQADEGVVGVMANVASFITGATQATGFKGLGGRFDRRGLLGFDADIEKEIRLTRKDSGQAVEMSARLDTVPMDPRVRQLLPRCLSDGTDKEALREFQTLWQDRVRRLLLEHPDDPEVIRTRLM
jgi:formylmethanofuran dehydrogenase subunit E